MIHQKQIEKFENSLYREKVGFDLKIKSWYEEDFQKSANEWYGRGKIYFIKCGKKFIGKEVSLFLNKLKSNPNYRKNKSFKRAVEDFILSDLSTKTHSILNSGNYNYRNDYYYVDENGLVQDYTLLDLYSTRYYLNPHIQNSNFIRYNLSQYETIASSLWQLRTLKEETKCFEYYCSTFKYIVRYKGLHYYVTNEELDYIDIQYKYIPRLDATHQVVINNALSTLQLLKLSITDLEYHGLVDIKENICNIIYKQGVK